MIIFLLICVTSYSVFISLMMVGWLRSMHYYQSVKTPLVYPSVTVVIALRNEAHRVDALLMSLVKQDYPNHLLQIIVIDDFSTDGTVEKLDVWVQQYDFIRRVEVASTWNHYQGKKRLLQSAIHQVTTEWIVTTDADCTMEPHWLMTLLKQWETKKFISGPVSFTSDGSLFHRVQQMEFSSLVGVGLSCIGLNKPLMCNGANLAFQKTAFEEVNGYQGNETIASGDDEFLMHKMQERFPGKIGAAVHKKSIVRTAPNDTWIQFYHQRKRWAGKWGKYRLNYVNLLALWVFIYQLILLCSLPFYFLGWCTGDFVLSIWLCRIIWDLFYLQIVTRFLSIKFNIVIFIGIVVLYPCYAVWFGLIARRGNYRWKDRDVI